MTTDSLFVTYTDHEMVKLLWHRIDRLSQFKRRNAPHRCVSDQKKLIAQARRVLHSRGIEYPERLTRTVWV